MTVTFALTPEQEQLLSQAARLQGVDADRLLHHLVDGALDQLASPPPASALRIPGLHAGQYTIRDDFDAPLPDNFWLGAD